MYGQGVTGAPDREVIAPLELIVQSTRKGATRNKISGVVSKIIVRDRMLRPGFTPALAPLVTGALLVIGCYAQQAPHPEFEVASIKPTAVDPGQVGQLATSGQIRFGPQIRGNTAEYRYMTLRQLVSEAYRVLPFQIVCPDWFMEDRFDIVARMPAGSRSDDAQSMLQSLLEERFKLALHREPREQPVAALVVGRDGAKLTPSSPSAKPANAADTPAGRPALPAGAFGGMMGSVAVTFAVDQATSSVRFDAKSLTLADLARFLMNFGAGNGRPVLDMTGIKGGYDLVLDIPFSMFGLNAAGERTASSAAAQAPPADYASDPGTGTIMTSLRRYGLDLKNLKAPVEHLVVDRADRKPAEN